MAWSGSTWVLTPWVSACTLVGMRPLAFTFFATCLCMACSSGNSEQPAPQPILPDASIQDAAQEAAPEAGPDAPEGNPYCLFTVQDPACSSCLRVTCGDTCATCSQLATCGDLYTCVSACSTTDCQQACAKKYPEAVKPLVEFLGAGGCVDMSCNDACNLGLAGSPSAGPDEFVQARKQCAEKLNAYRAQVAVAPLTQWPARETCADIQVKTDAKNNFPQGMKGMCSEKGRVECTGYPGTVEEVMTNCFAKLWAQGPGTTLDHVDYNTMASPDFTRVSCGFYPNGDGSVWVLANFYP